MNKKYIAVIVVALVAAVLVIYATKDSDGPQINIKRLSPERGDISVTFSTTGILDAQNMLEIKPPVNGRIEEVLVREGDKVSSGAVIALMSSTERAALLDSARAQGAEALAYWEEVYKATPLVSPIPGEVIVRAIEPGQTVTANDPIIVISDRLIVKAQFDETDIGRVKIGQQAYISIDAYPERMIPGRIDHIGYESKLVNNVTIYDVDIIPEQVPHFFRSGMSATVEVVEQKKSDVLIIPLGSIITDGTKSYVLTDDKAGGPGVRKEVKVGLSNGNVAEIISGLSEEDVVISQQRNYSPPKRSINSSPFMFGGPRKKQNDKTQ
ncbi:MAG: efflux RND transporter periplasmic adaptor subunit [Nitrospirota bacterium]|nr:MAG: efflux RND transporter periplasmic adaptor subunit [Nitrospirota bacterium]